MNTAKLYIFPKVSIPVGIINSLLLITLVFAGCATSKDYPGPVHGLTFNGVVQSIDVKKHRLTVAPLKEGDPVLFVWEDDTKFYWNEDIIRPERMEVGRHVRIHYHIADNYSVAHHVYILAPSNQVH